MDFLVIAFAVEVGETRLKDTWRRNQFLVNLIREGVSQKTGGLHTGFQLPFEDAAIAQEITEDVLDSQVAVGQVDFAFNQVPGAEMAPATLIDLGQAHDPHIEGVGADRFEEIREIKVVKNHLGNELGGMCHIRVGLFPFHHGEGTDADTNRIEFLGPLDDTTDYVRDLG